MSVPHDGYVWWYLDAMSDDGAFGITLIAFIGSVFSPWYAWARRRGPTDPTNHCAVNVALYGPRGRRWCMTERGAGSLARDADWLTIGPSALHWDGSELTVRIEEMASPLPRRVRGTIRLIPEAVEPRVWTLDSVGLHRWRPIAPCARAEVRFNDPALSWSGPAYFDTNAGDRPLERDFPRWNWCRAEVPGGMAVFYDVTRAAPDPSLRLAMRYDRAGGVEEIPAPPSQPLPRTRWRIDRRIGVQPGHLPEVVATLEDTPFYARSIVRTRLAGHHVVAMHESLSLERFRAPWVQAMLPFRMPRMAGRQKGTG